MPPSQGGFGKGRSVRRRSWGPAPRRRRRPSALGRPRPPPLMSTTDVESPLVRFMPTVGAGRPPHRPRPPTHPPVTPAVEIGSGGYRLGRRLIRHVPALVDCVRSWTWTCCCAADPVTARWCPAAGRPSSGRPACTRSRAGTAAGTDATCACTGTALTAVSRTAEAPRTAASDLPVRMPAVKRHPALAAAAPTTPRRARCCGGSSSRSRSPCVRSIACWAPAPPDRGANRHSVAEDSAGAAPDLGAPGTTFIGTRRRLEAMLSDLPGPRSM